MSTSYQPPIAIRDIKTIVPQVDVEQFVKTAAAESLSDIRLKMSCLLQTTLDVHKLVEILSRQLSHVVEIQGVSYCHPGQNLDIFVGHQGKHQANYRLNTDKTFFGELAFSRNQRFKESELTLIESLLDLFIYPLRNALQYQEAVNNALTDPLTGAGNRMAMNNAIGHEIRLAKRYDLPLSVLMIDVDNFKQINDTLGHGTGDLVLKSVALDIMNTIRNSDICFRFGGEEFLVLLTKTSIHQAKLIAERIRAIIETGNVLEGRNDPITVSIGAAGFEAGLTSEQLIARADRAMYQAKHGGKNQVNVEFGDLGLKQAQA